MPKLTRALRKVKKTIVKVARAFADSSKTLKSTVSKAHAAAMKMADNLNEKRKMTDAKIKKILADAKEAADKAVDAERQLVKAAVGAYAGLQVMPNTDDAVQPFSKDSKAQAAVEAAFGKAAKGRSKTDKAIAKLSVKAEASIIKESEAEEKRILKALAAIAGAQTMHGRLKGAAALDPALDKKKLAIQELAKPDVVIEKHKALLARAIDAANKEAENVRQMLQKLLVTPAPARPSKPKSARRARSL